MEWLQVSVYTTSAGIEPVSGRLYGVGVTGLEIEDAEDFFDFLENNRRSWDYVDEELVEQKKGETCVRAYVTDNASGQEMLRAIRAAIEELRVYDTEGAFGRLAIELNRMQEEDWANNWKQYFHPIEVGKRILIEPEWEQAPADTDRIIFRVDPGMTFGTGSHETTQLCIESLENYITKESVMLDLGCGSGILSIICLMLGAKEATAVDIDPNAVHIAYANADRNGVKRARYRVLSGNLLEDETLCASLCNQKYHIIAANIVADVIIGLAPLARRCIHDNGIFVVSGIIEDRIDDVKDALCKNGFEIVDLKRRADWAAMTCRVQNKKG